MKSFMIKILLFILGLLVLQVVIFYVFMLCPKDMTDFQLALLDKHKLLSQTHEQRLIFIGGSNIAFGLDSKAVAAATQKNVVNMGLHASNGLKFMLDDLQPLLVSGDVVVIMPEYEQFFDKDTFYGGKPLCELILKYYPQGLAYLDVHQWIRFIKNVPSVVTTTLISDGLYHFRAGKMPPDVYARTRFNEDGDYIGHLQLPNKRVADAEAIKGPLFHPAIDALNQFNHYVALHHVTCYLMYPGLKESNYRLNEQKLQKLDQTLRQTLSFKILGRPADMHFNDDLFHDTMYHLNKPGREKRTAAVIRLLLD